MISHNFLRTHREAQKIQGKKNSGKRPGVRFCALFMQHPQDHALSLTESSVPLSSAAGHLVQPDEDPWWIVGSHVIVDSLLWRKAQVAVAQISRTSYGIVGCAIVLSLSQKYILDVLSAF